MQLESAEFLACELMEAHGLGDWSFNFSNCKNIFGRCWYRLERIELSRNLTKLNDIQTVRGVILHEIAHALTFGHHHDRVWKRKLIEIGGDGKRCYSLPIELVPKSKWIGDCPSCGKKIIRYRLVSSSQQAACGDCCNEKNGGKWKKEFKYNWKRNY